MDLGKIPLLKMITTQMGWLNQRQKVLSENIANADTPEFVPRDLTPLDFADMARSQYKKLAMAGSSPQHITETTAAKVGAFKDQKDKKYPSEPSGNAVVLEEQMLKLSESQVDYELITRLYRKHVGMLRTALGRQ
jgi:flagellar basal-body rod protein FlgB